MSTQTGKRAEEATARWLQETKSWELVTMNWRCAKAEIDIIMEYDNVLHFIEVKYRKNNFSGEGYAVVNKNKINKMHLGALEYIKESNWENSLQLDVVSVTGSDELIFELFENITG